MKIFSNFDTSLRQKTFKEYQDKYGVENVLCFGRSKLYWFVKVFFPTIGLLLINLIALYFFYIWLSGEYFIYIIILTVIIDLVFIFPIIGKFIDYTMDFIIVIPNSIMMYDQSGLFRKKVITISALSIKSISIKKDGLLYSIFDNGDLVILTEGDVENNGEIILRWVPRPEKRKNQIVRVIGIDLKANQNPRS